MSKKQTTKKIDITVSPEELQRFQEEAFDAFRRELELPGFRRGTVTPDVAKKHIDTQAVFADAIERAISKKGGDAIEEHRDHIVGRPEVRVKKAAPGNPLEFELEFHVLPEVDVSSWRQLRIPFKPKEVTEKDIDEAIEQIRKSRVRMAAVNRAAQKGDMVDIDFVTRMDGVKAEGGESKNHPVVLGESGFVPGFDDAIVGMEKGEEKTVTLPFPKDWPKKSFAGRDAEYTITLNNVMERTLPELNDEFAKSLGDFSSMEALRANVRKGIMLEREMEEKQRVRKAAVEKLARGISEQDIPDMIIEQELERMKQEFEGRIAQSGITLEQYLEQMGKKEEELQKDWKDAAVERVRGTLVIRAVAKHEDIQPDEREVKSRTEALIKQHTAPGAEQLQLDPEAVRSYTETIIVNEMTLDLIEGVVAENE